MSFQTKLRTKDLFHFSIYYSYTGKTGIFTLIALIAGMLLLYRGIGLKEGVNYTILGGLMFVLFLVVNPLMLYIRAKKDAVSGDAYKEPTTYHLTEEGVGVKQQGQEGVIPWSQILKIRSFWGIFIIFTGKNSAFVFPEDVVGHADGEIMTYIRNHMGRSQSVRQRATGYGEAESETEDKKHHESQDKI